MTPTEQAIHFAALFFDLHAAPVSRLAYLRMLGSLTGSENAPGWCKRR